MSFFDSEIVQEEMKEISKLQDEIYAKVFSFSSMDSDDKLEHVEMLENLLKKQKILYTRLSLSDDPEAKEMKDRILESAKMMGLPSDANMNLIFDNMNQMLDSMKTQIDKSDVDM